MNRLCRPAARASILALLLGCQVSSGASTSSGDESDATAIDPRDAGAGPRDVAPAGAERSAADTAGPDRTPQDAAVTPVGSAQILHRTIDLDIGEEQEVALGDGQTVKIKLVRLPTPVRGVGRSVRIHEATVSVNGAEVTLSCGVYNLPVTIGPAQVDCPITKALYPNTSDDWWRLGKDARIRLWPAGSDLTPPKTFVYPVKQRWNAADLWADNEVMFGGWVPDDAKFYYHAFVDIGGIEGTPVVSASDGVVVAIADNVLDERPVKSPVAAEDKGRLYPGLNTNNMVVVVVRDDNRGWYHQYFHLKSADPGLKLGAAVKAGESIGLLGKDGNSGGWAHLNYDIVALQPPGKWGIELAYAFLREAYVREQKPALLAVAGPLHHEVAAAGTTLTFDAGLSKGFAAAIDKYEWTFFDDSRASAKVARKKYDQPGKYCEILKVTDKQGNVDYDFIRISVFDPVTKRGAPWVDPNFAPSFGVSAGDPLTFSERTFFDDQDLMAGETTWDFGDKTPMETTRSRPNQDGYYIPDGYARIVHSYQEPGQYLVRVWRSVDGRTGTNRLHVTVGR